MYAENSFKCVDPDTSEELLPCDLSIVDIVVDPRRQKQYTSFLKEPDFLLENDCPVLGIDSCPRGHGFDDVPADRDIHASVPSTSTLLNTSSDNLVLFL